jgi:lipoprotein YgeR
MLNRKNIAVLFLLFLTFAGCATRPELSAPVLPKPSIPPSVRYHRVERGQTLWRIAKLYSMDIDELAALNNIRDSAKLETGQQLMVPADRKAQSTVAGVPEEDFSWPVRGKVLTGFNQMVDSTLNKGINIEPSRSLDVLASRSGKVAFYSEDFLDLGKTVILEHPEGFWTVYARLREVYVKPGDLAARGAVIAKAGNAGATDKVYLHFEIRKGSKSENPMFYLP